MTMCMTEVFFTLRCDNYVFNNKLWKPAHKPTVKKMYRFEDKALCQMWRSIHVSNHVIWINFNASTLLIQNYKTVAFDQQRIWNNSMFRKCNRNQF